MARSRLIEIDDENTLSIEGQSFAGLEELTRGALADLGERAKAAQAAHEAERGEVGQALEQALKREPKLKSLVDKASKALQQESASDRDGAAKLASWVKATLAQLAELKERHSL